MSIEDKISYYKKTLDCFDDTMEKYRFLLDQGKASDSFPEEYREDSFKVTGCQAQVWLVPYLKSNLMYFYYDSDAFISKGMITILCDIFQGHTPQEIQKCEVDLLSDLKLDVLLTPGRRNGVYSMILKIKEHANSYINNINIKQDT
tara:strand:+ start:4891 stop:5328 length:438 start_codon:yes stop_codon:yes gene_type:complete